MEAKDVSRIEEIYQYLNKINSRGMKQRLLKKVQSTFGDLVKKEKKKAAGEEICKKEKKVNLKMKTQLKAPE